MEEDALSQLIGSLQLRSALYTRFEVSAPWGHRVEHRGVIKFVLVTEGSCWLRTAALKKPLELYAGDLFLVLDGAPYSVSERATTRCVDCLSLESRRESFVIKYGGGGARTTLISVAFELAADDDGALASALPPFIHLRIDSHRSAGLHALADLLRHELTANELGALPIVRRLGESLFISALRFYVERGELSGRGPLTAIADPHLRRAMKALHGDLAHSWTVESLAHRAGMSRASFAQKFRDAAGETPLEYLTRRRVERAQRLLKSGRSTKEVAVDVGYDSPVSFARAFRRVVGTAPGAFRSRERESSRR